MASVSPHSVSVSIQGSDRRRQCGRCGCGVVDSEVVDQVLVGGDDDAEEIVQSQEEDTQPMKTMPTPEMPTEAEVEEHRIDHLPYRNWCRECVEGFGREDAHTCKEVPRTVPVVSMDYLFLSRMCFFLPETNGSHRRASPC